MILALADATELNQKVARLRMPTICVHLSDVG